jgi:hypothetical protein
MPVILPEQANPSIPITSPTGPRRHERASSAMTVEVDITLYTAQPPQPVTDGCVAVYAAAFGQPPYAESPADAELLRERIDRYCGRDGYAAAVAHGPAGPEARRHWPIRGKVRFQLRSLISIPFSRSCRWYR